MKGVVDVASKQESTSAACQQVAGKPRPWQSDYGYQLRYHFCIVVISSP